VLQFDIWELASIALAVTLDRTAMRPDLTMRNEISAMANKIWPNDGSWFNMGQGRSTG